jgi:hypothetical protein
LERLWVIGNDWTNLEKIYRPKHSDFVEPRHGEKSLKLQRFLHPNGWGPEDSHTTEQKAADEIQEAEWQQGDDKANADEEKREGELENAGVAAQGTHDSREEEETPPPGESSDNENESDDKNKKRKELEEENEKTSNKKKSKPPAKNHDDPYT